jgi:hypothetical protein
MSATTVLDPPEGDGSLTTLAPTDPYAETAASPAPGASTVSGGRSSNSSFFAPQPGPDAADSLDTETSYLANDGASSPHQTEPERPSAADPHWTGPASGLVPYQEWTERPLPHPDTAPISEVVAGLAGIVAAEGPIHAQRAYRLYIRAAGGLRVGTEVRRALHAATQEARRTGTIYALKEGRLAEDELTLYIPGRPEVFVREIGPRQLLDVPRSEVAGLIRQLGLRNASADVVKRTVLSTYGLVRLTARTSQYLDDCIAIVQP